MKTDTKSIIETPEVYENADLSNFSTDDVF